jgi:hypothetical protein
LSGDAVTDRGAIASTRSRLAVSASAAVAASRARVHGAPHLAQSPVQLAQRDGERAAEAGRVREVFRADVEHDRGVTQRARRGEKRRRRYTSVGFRARVKRRFRGGVQRSKRREDARRKPVVERIHGWRRSYAFAA